MACCYAKTNTKLGMLSETQNTENVATIHNSFIPVKSFPFLL